MLYRWRIQDITQYNKSQLAAIKHHMGPMLVLAGPGSGKTAVITRRISYLTEEYNENPSNILVITFTRAAAAQMQQRYKSIAGMNSRSGRVSFGTFHSVFFGILRLAYGYTADQIIREEERIKIVRSTLNNTDLDIEDEGEFIASVLGEISCVKGDMIDLEHYYATSCSEEIFKQFYADYEEALRKLGKIDFDDMLVLCYELLTQRPDILSSCQKKYKYILIDEFQDINRLQYEIVRLLALPENNLFIVGDDDQSIYRFRGAKPEIMLGFEKDYPDAGRVILDINYRSTKEIVEAAGILIKHNTKRFSKNISADKKDKGSVTICRFKDIAAEAEAMIEEISDYHAAGHDWNDIAVLYRTNTGPRFFMEKLMEYNIPFKVHDSIPNIYEHWISKNITAYLKLSKGLGGRAELLQIINRPNRYISRDALGAGVDLESIKTFYMEKSWMVERIEQLEYDLKMISKMAPYAAVNYIRKAVGYDEYLTEYAQFRRMKPEELYDVLNQIQESAANFKSFELWQVHMDNYANDLKKHSGYDNKDADGVVLMTMHGAKGLEYPVVYIPDANEGMTPHRKAVIDADMEEERRMFYVAMTRAKESLHIYYVDERYHKKQEISRFVKEIGMK